MENWIRREQRFRKNSIWRLLALACLVIVALALLAYKFIPELTSSRSIIKMTSADNIINSDDQVRAFFVLLIAELNLDTTYLKSQPLNYINRKTSYPNFRLDWPEDYPFAWLEQQANRQKTKFEDLAFEALELSEKQGLVLWLIAPSGLDTLGELFLESSSRAVPIMSSIAFLFDNFADFKKDEAQDLAWIDIPFGFVLKPDEVPDKKLGKALKASQGQCFLQIPADRASWDIILNSHRLAKHIPSNKLNENNVRLILEEFPVLAGFFWVNTGELDPDLVRIVTNQANLLDLTYLYLNESPNFADSLAYLKGLKIKKWANLKDLTGLSTEELYGTLLKDTNYLTIHDKGVGKITSSPENLAMIKSLLPLYEKLNIILVRPQRLAVSADSL